MKTILKALILIFIASPVFAQDNALPYDPVKEIMKSRTEKSKGLQGASWNSSKKEKAEEDTQKEEEKKEELWNKYKEAEAKTDEKEHTPAEEQKEEEPQSAAKSEEKAEKKPKTGLTAILEKYKNSQENKGGMNSRTFGNLDR